MKKQILSEELKRMHKLAGLINENDVDSEYIRKQISRAHGEEPSDEEMGNIMAALQKDKEKSLKEAELLKEETIEDFFDFLGRNPSKSSIATVMYTNPVKVNKFIVDELGNKVPNPMFDKLFKNTRFMFRWQDTYKRAAERVNPDYELGKRSGTYEKVEGVEILERGKSGLYLPIVPTGSEYAYSVYENGKYSPISKEEARKYMPEYKERSGGSGADFRPLIVDRIYKINAGGNTWVNPNFQYEYLGPDKMAEDREIESKEIPPYEGPNNPLDNQVFEDIMIYEGQLGRTITKMLIEEVLKSLNEWGYPPGVSDNDPYLSGEYDGPTSSDFDRYEPSINVSESEESVDGLPMWTYEIENVILGKGEVDADYIMRELGVDIWEAKEFNDLDENGDVIEFKSAEEIRKLTYKYIKDSGKTIEGVVRELISKHVIGPWSQGDIYWKEDESDYRY